MSKKPKSAYRDGFGIMNAEGDMWSSDLFPTEDAAHKHAADFWRGSATAQHTKRTVDRALKALRALQSQEAGNE